ncbi:MAG: hypothetical protein HY664_01385 [Chloroflexi bacterium]|nr:hypothetical protein [Chloroflexota bacterium]
MGKGVAALPEVKRALNQGTVIVARGTTNAFVAEELIGIVVPKAEYAAGIITDGRLRVTPRGVMLKPYVIRQGQVVDEALEEAVRGFDAEDVFIKGANAVDIEGNAGILLGGETGGTIGSVLSILISRGSYLIAPVGLEKLIPSVIQAASKVGIRRVKYSMGMKVGLMPLVTAKVITETQALKVLTGVTATHVASGGIGGSEGSVVLVLEGAEEAVERAYRLVEAIKGEAAVPKPSAVPVPAS